MKTLRIVTYCKNAEDRDSIQDIIEMQIRGDEHYTGVFTSKGNFTATFSSFLKKAIEKAEKGPQDISKIGIEFPDDDNPGGN